MRHVTLHHTGETHSRIFYHKQLMGTPVELNAWITPRSNSELDYLAAGCVLRLSDLTLTTEYMQQLNNRRYLIVISFQEITMTIRFTELQTYIAKRKEMRQNSQLIPAKTLEFSTPRLYAKSQNLLDRQTTFIKERLSTMLQMHQILMYENFNSLKLCHAHGEIILNTNLDTSK